MVEYPALLVMCNSSPPVAFSPGSLMCGALSLQSLTVARCVAATLSATVQINRHIVIGGGAQHLVGSRLGGDMQLVR